MNNSWKKHIEQWTKFLTLFLNSVNNDENDVGEKKKIERQLSSLERAKYAAVCNPNVLYDFISQNFTNYTIDISDFFLSLNNEQKQAVRQAIAPNNLTLIQGPPGTGKTQVIAEICLQLCKNNPKIKILICSETHIAVNNILNKINNCNYKILRIKDKINDSSLEKYYPNKIIENYIESLNDKYSKNIVELIKERLNINKDKSVEKDLVLSSNIIGMTCNKVADYDFYKENEAFDVVIIDEVCKSTLPEIIIPLSVAKKAILVGDPKQLPPVFCSEEIEIIKNIENCELAKYIYIDSLFENALNQPQLLVQYRMEKKIGNLISNLFYNGILKNGENRVVEDSIIWYNYTSEDKCPLNSNDTAVFINKKEIEIIVNILNNINLKNLSVAIISPYRKQVEEIKKKIKSLNFKNLKIEVDTVDGFQGKESEVVIFCLTRNYGTFRFLADKRRLNVALSRAKNKLYIIGDLDYAKKNEILLKIEKYAKIINK